MTESNDELTIEDEVLMIQICKKLVALKEENPDNEEGENLENQKKLEKALNDIKKPTEKT